MSEQDNDRLEQFFRKAASSPDVPFNEEDWKKLEARLDAQDALISGVKKTGSKVVSAVVISIVLLFTAGLIVNDRYDFIPLGQLTHDENVPGEKIETPGANSDAISGNTVEEKQTGADNDGRVNGVSPDVKELSVREEASDDIDKLSDDRVLPPTTPFASLELTESRDIRASDRPERIGAEGSVPGSAGVIEIKDEQILRDFMHRTPVLALEHKQKAIVELPGAEEVETGEAESVVNKEEPVSDQEDRVATPRLSLLLSFAPDFSGTSLGQYSAPGKAFGAMIHYHIGNRWSVSAGVIKNNKQYTGDGEDYQPPAGYWKYYTNGKVPASIYGACDVLEFPIMVQYQLMHKGKNKLLAGAGTSSYLMLKESYQYQFDEPNPGARERWDSRSSSRFLMNMVNLTIGYERQVLPGFMIGIEPYVKIPIEKIGWCNLKLFSTGASVTMRYTILGKHASVTSRSRGPD